MVDQVIERVDVMLKQLPEFFDESTISTKFPLKYDDSMATVLRLETATPTPLGV